MAKKTRLDIDDLENGGEIDMDSTESIYHTILGTKPRTDGVPSKGGKRRPTPAPKVPTASLIGQIKGWQNGLKEKKGLMGLAARNPGLTLGAGAMLAPGLLRMLGRGAEGLGDALTGDGVEQRLEDENKQRAVVLGQQLRMKRLQRDTQENMARIMSMQPEVAQQLMAGRRLPKGAVVLGGQPRQDLLQEMAQRMSRDEGEGGGDGGFA